MRNPNGFGSVYKLSGRRRNPYIARMTIGTEIAVNKKTGKEYAKPIYQIIGYFKEKKDAMDALTLHRISPVSPKKDITLGQLHEEWSESHYKRISKSTEDTYKAAWLYLKKYEKAKFNDIRTSHLQAIIDSAKKSRSTLEKIKNVCIMLYAYAMQNDICNKNYAEYIILPKETKEEREIFTDLQIKTLMDNAADDWVKTILIMIYTGLRITEMLTLTKFNIDLEKRTITGGIKTEAGRDRIIPIHPKILDFIKYWYNKGGEALICTEKGKSLSTRYYREKKYTPAMERLKMPDLTPHACRHTFASLMARAKADPLSIQKIIGHTDYAFTANTYTHADVEELRKAINLI